MSAAAEGESPCALCGKVTPEADLCSDGVCRGCHKSLTFEDCCDGSWVARQRAAAGMAPAEERQRGTVREQLAALEGDPQQQRIAASRRGADVLRSLRRAR